MDGQTIILIYSKRAKVLLRVVVYHPGERVERPDLLCRPGEEFFVSQLSGEVKIDQDDPAALHNFETIEDAKRMLEEHLGQPLNDSVCALVNSDGVVDDVICLDPDLVGEGDYPKHAVMSAGDCGRGWELTAEGDLVAPPPPVKGR